MNVWLSPNREFLVNFCVPDRPISPKKEMVWIFEIPSSHFLFTKLDTQKTRAPWATIVLTANFSAATGDKITVSMSSTNAWSFTLFESPELRMSQKAWMFLFPASLFPWLTNQLAQDECVCMIMWRLVFLPCSGAHPLRRQPLTVCLCNQVFFVLLLYCVGGRASCLQLLFPLNAAASFPPSIPRLGTLTLRVLMTPSLPTMGGLGHAMGLADKVGICVCRLHPPNDRRLCLLPTCRQCRPDTLVKFS